MTKCNAPWCHVYHHSNGAIYPCCRFAGVNEHELGTVKEPLKEVWNNAPLRQLRQQFLDGKALPKICGECVDGPTKHNMFFDGIVTPEEIQTTSSTGEFKFNYKLFNVIESNVCNLRCVYCSNDYSNSILDVDGRNTKRNCFSSLKEFQTYFDAELENIEIFGFAGGESMFQPGYFWILDELVKRRLTHKQIYFVTNLSTLEYQGRHIGEVLTQFSNAQIAASIDTLGRAHSRIRRGSMWESVEKNRIELLRFPVVKFTVHAVVTNLSVNSLPDFHYNWNERGLLGKGDIRYLVLTSPAQFKIENLRGEIRVQTREKLLNYQRFLSDCIDTSRNKCTPSERIQVFIDLLSS